MKTLSLILFLVASITAQDKLNVSFSVSSDSSEKANVESYIARELRSLGDVNVLEKDGFENLNIFFFEDQAESGRTLGYTMTAAITWRATCVTAGKTRPCYVFEEMYVFSGGKDDLRKMCERLITAFDRNTLQSLRKK